MAQLRQDYQAFEAREAEVLVVGPENRAAFVSQWQEETFPFIGLPDPNHQVANLYGQEVRLLKLGRLPALVVIDKQGRLRYQHHGHSMRDIPANETILNLLDRLNNEIRPAHSTERDDLP